MTNTASGPTIWLVNQYANPGDAGASRPRAMATELERNGFAVKLLLTHKGSKATASTIDFVHIPSLSYTKNGPLRVLSMVSFGAGVLVRGLLASPSERPDVIIGSSPHLIGAYSGSILAKVWRIPFILEVRDIWPLSIQKFFGMKEEHLLVRWFSYMEKSMYRQAEFLILLFSGAHRHVWSVVGREVEYVEVPNGIDLSTWPYEPYQARPEGLFRIVYTGAHGVPNSLLTVIQAAAILDKEAPNIVFDLYGDGVEKEMLIAIRDSLRLRNVTFHDPVPKSEVPHVLSRADLLIIAQKDTDLYEYGLSPNKLAEYMGSGRAIVNCIRSGEDPVARAGAGWTVPPEDPVALAAKLREISMMDPGELRQRGMAGRAYATVKYDWSMTVSKLARRIKKSIDDTRHSPGITESGASDA